MLGKLLGAYIGSKIDQRDGEGGAKGALIGAATAGLARRAMPLALAIGGVVVAKRLIDRARGKTRSDAASDATP
jgi:hypothetical protein